MGFFRKCLMFLWSIPLNMKVKGMTICYHHEQVFGNVFERRENKCYGVLVKPSKVKSEQTSDHSVNGSGTKNQKYQSYTRITILL